MQESPAVTSRLRQALDPLLGHGAPFSTSDAAEFGLDEHDVRNAVRRRLIERVTRGWYAPVDDRLDARGRHRRLALCVQRRIPGASVCGTSALVVHGLPTMRPDLSRARLMWRGSEHYRSTADAVLYACDGLDLDDDATVHSPAHAITSVGIATPLAGLVAADAALHTGLVTSDYLKAAASAAVGRRGSRTWRSMLARCDARSESPPETLARFALMALGHRVTPQYAVSAEGRRFRIDLAVEELGLAVEVDGAVKYAAPTTPDAAAPESVVMAEKAREAVLVRAGWRVLRLTWREIVAPDGTVRYENLRSLIDATAPSRGGHALPHITPRHRARSTPHTLGDQRKPEVEWG